MASVSGYTKTQLDTLLAAKAATAALAAKADLVGGLIPSSQIPALALNTAVTVGSQAAMLALTATQVQPGDLAIRSDGAGTFILLSADPSQLANWSLLNTPTDVVTSVAGKNGAVTLGPTDVGADPAGAAAAVTASSLGLGTVLSQLAALTPTLGADGNYHFQGA